MISYDLPFDMNFKKDYEVGRASYSVVSSNPHDRLPL